MGVIPDSTYGAGYGAGYRDCRTGKTDEKTENRVSEWMDAIARRKEEIVEKVRRGETEPSIPTGAASFTYKQWDRMMRRVDRAIDAMKERVEADEKEQEDREDAADGVKRKEPDSITTEMLEELLGISIKDGSAVTGGELAGQVTGVEAPPC